MLLGLTLKNFTIIEDLSVGLSSGLNIITGETGAGKSVIVDAINIILGDKAPAENIKTGKEEAHIEALFDISKDETIKERLVTSGFDIKSGELLIKRIIYRNSRSRVFINGSLSTLTLLSTITQGLVDIFSQHEHQSLLREENHLKIVDDFGKTGDEASHLRDIYQYYSSIKKELDDLEQSKKDKVEKEDYLKFQLNEIVNAALTIGEDERLGEEKLKLVNAERLESSASSAYEELYEKENSVLGTLQKLSNDFKEIARIDPKLNEVAESIEKGMLQLEEAAFSIRDYTTELSSDSQTLEVIEDRIHLINSLKRKYGDTIEQIIQKRDEIEHEVSNIENFDERVRSLSEESEKLMGELLQLARTLSKTRKQSSKKLSEMLEQELKEVGIKGGKFHIQFNDKVISSSGIDAVSFLFSANPGEDPKPLNRVASGGELSRIMLVLKEVIARVEGGSVIIFDEADSGVGGAIAEAVGQKIRNLSRSYQVICITHLPQVAKFADSHLSVSKTHNDNKTQVTIKNLDENERVVELARMIGGFNITQKTLDTAQEMLKH
ncbi:MAG: DNA repair protein RecN [Thermodesulfobacteriales bacterium]|nr:MAG: DNA repair protein RecN [Thermodesulfobacteriales bacterium]